MSKTGLILALLIGAAVAGCASTRNLSFGGENDPLEPMNRQIFGINQALDEHVMLPIATFYHNRTPQLVRTGLHNFLTNLDMPVTIANDLLQAKPLRFAQAVGRFGLNSTVGIAGLIDVASRQGIPNETADFGQTLGIYGVPEGPYLVLPLLGPNPPRDILGDIGDHQFDAMTYIRMRDKVYWRTGRQVLELLDERERNIDSLKRIQRTSVDYYATVRSLYRQDRNAKINGGQPVLEDLPEE